MTTEEEIRRAVAVLDTQRAQLESLVRQEELLQMSLEEHLRARETADRCRKAKKDSEILVPVGAGTFLFMGLRDNAKALINIGSDVIIEESLEKVIERLDKHVKELRDASNSLESKISELDSRIKAQTGFVQNLYDNLQDSVAKPPRRKQ